MSEPKPIYTAGEAGSVIERDGEQIERVVAWPSMLANPGEQAAMLIERGYTVTFEPDDNRVVIYVYGHPHMMGVCSQPLPVHDYNTWGGWLHEINRMAQYGELD